MNVFVGKIKNNPGSIQEIELSGEVKTVDAGDEELKFLGPVQFKGTAKNTGQAISIKGQLKAMVELTCSRCSETINYRTEAQFDENYSNQIELAKEDDESIVHPFEGDVIDISPQIIQSVFLVLPMKALCQTECEGLCPECGENLNKNRCWCETHEGDQRFKVLEKLLNQNSSEGGVTSGSTKAKDFKGE